MNTEERNHRRELFRVHLTKTQEAVRRGDWKAVVWWMQQARGVLDSLAEPEAIREPVAHGSPAPD